MVAMGESTRFGGLDIAFNQDILRPRPWTLAQSLWAADLLADVPPGPVLELCCGAGHLGLATMRTTDRWAILIDIDPLACEFARANAANAGLGDRVEVRCAQLGDALSTTERFPLIIADPPWVPSEAVARYPNDPLRAINGGAQGLDIVRVCLTTIRDHLHPSGAAVLQLGTDTQLAALDSEFADVLRLVETRVFPGNGILAHFVLRAPSSDR